METPSLPACATPLCATCAKISPFPGWNGPPSLPPSPNPDDEPDNKHGFLEPHRSPVRSSRSATSGHRSMKPAQSRKPRLGNLSPIGQVCQIRGEGGSARISYRGNAAIDAQTPTKRHFPPGCVNEKEQRNLLKLGDLFH